MTCNRCCQPDDCCDQVVPVTQNINNYSIDSVGLTIVVSDVSATEKLITITADIEDFINLDCYFTKNPLNPGEKTASAPTTPGWIEKILTTNASGVATLSVAYSGASDTWYLVIQGINGVLAISDAITIGT